MATPASRRHRARLRVPAARRSSGSAPPSPQDRPPAVGAGRAARARADDGDRPAELRHQGPEVHDATSAASARGRARRAPPAAPARAAAAARRSPPSRSPAALPLAAPPPGAQTTGRRPRRPPLPAPPPRHLLTLLSSPSSIGSCFDNGRRHPAPISEFDQMLYEDANTNWMDEALTLFDQICNHQSFKETSSNFNKARREPLPLLPLPHFPPHRPLPLTLSSRPQRDLRDEARRTSRLGPVPHRLRLRRVDRLFSRSSSTNKEPEKRQVYCHATCA